MATERSSAPTVIAVIAALLALGAIYYFAFARTATPLPTPTPTMTINPTLEETVTPTDLGTPAPTTTVSVSQTFTLVEQNNSDQSGTVLLEQVGSQVRVTIDLSNPTTTPEPAHIHTGKCPTPGSVLYPLENVVNGTSVTLITADLDDLLASGNLSVNVHKSAQESNTYYACGDLIVR